MFGWFANLLLKSPIVGTGCACCEAKKEQLRQMQKEILGEDIPEENRVYEKYNCNCNEYKSRYEVDSNDDEEMTSSLHYKL